RGVRMRREMEIRCRSRLSNPVVDGVTDTRRIRLTCGAEGDAVIGVASRGEEIVRLPGRRRRIAKRNRPVRAEKCNIVRRDLRRIGGDAGYRGGRGFLEGAG